MITLAEHFARSCDGKIRHPDRQAAEKEAQRLAADGRPMRVYGCLCCGGYHAGHAGGSGTAK